MKKTLALLLLLAGLTVETRAETLIWNGRDGHMTWDYKDTNWLQGETSAKYEDGAEVVFSDVGSGEVNLKGYLRPASVLVNSDKDYAFESGCLSGNMQLTKSGSGTLTLKSSNGYVGDTLIKEGTLVLGVEGAIGNQCSVTVEGGKLVLNQENAIGVRSRISLKGGTLDLGGYNWWSRFTVTLDGNSCCIGNGSIDGDLVVGEDKTLTLCGNLSGTGTIYPNNNVTLNLGGFTLGKGIYLAGHGVVATIGNGTLDSDIFVGDMASLKLCGNLSVSGTTTLRNNAELDLGGYTLVTGLELAQTFATTSICNGKIVLCNNVGQRADINISDAVLDMNNHTLDLDDMGILLDGTSALGNGTLNGTVQVSAGTHTLCGDLKGTGNINLTDGCTLGFNTYTLSKAVVLQSGKAIIGNGTIDASVTINDGAQAHFTGETHIKSGTVTAGETSIKALKEDIPGLLKELTVTQSLIGGIGQGTSLADGLEIQSESDLLIQSMTITADNKISVGDNTITLRNITIKLSETTYNLVEGVYYFNLSDLFHCSVDMANVTFDASDLTLPEGFNPETNGIAFNLGDAKLTDATPSRDISLLMGGYASQTVSVDDQGRVVFTNLVETPEPTTGSLSLLALAGLAARRRRK